jgi:hypothetical protein
MGLILLIVILLLLFGGGGYGYRSGWGGPQFGGLGGLIVVLVVIWLLAGR